MTDAAPRGLRFFFALWPTDSQRRTLAELTAPAIAPIRGKAVPPGNLHVTLAFLGAVPGPALERLMEVGGRGGDPAVQLAFSRIEYWAKPRVVVALAPRVPQAGLRIVERLWGELVTLGFEREERPWHPHLTLVRRVREPPPPTFGPTLPAKAAAAAASGWGLALVESSTHPEGVRYRPLAEWPQG